MSPIEDRVARGEWECMECGCIVKGLATKRPAECPECGASARVLEFFADDDWDEAEDEDDESADAPWPSW